MDSRKPGETGIGVGTMWYSVDEAGAPVVYHWGKREHSSASPTIAIGRPVDPPTSP